MILEFLSLIQTVAMKFILKHGKTDKDIRNLRQEIEVHSTAVFLPHMHFRQFALLVQLRIIVSPSAAICNFADPQETQT